MGLRNGDENLEPGLTTGDSHFYDDEPAPCECGHYPEDHRHEDKHCEVEDCDCPYFEAFEV